MQDHYHFDRCEVRPAERLLLVDGVPAVVGARAFDLLLCLLAHRDRVIAKHEVLEIVWPGLVVEENNLSVQVSALRKLLGPRAITTIPGRGYRFSLDVRQGGALPQSGMHQSQATAVDKSTIEVISASFPDKGPRELKNIARPTRAYAIVPDDDIPAALPLADAGTVRDSAAKEPSSPGAPGTKRDGGTPSRSATPRPVGLFVGRKPELAQLANALHGARKGFGRVVLLAGSGGMGKTRLAQQLELQADQGGTPVLWGRCLEEAGAPAYWPWRQLIRSYLRSGIDTDPAQTFGSGLADIAGIVPEVAAHFGLRPKAAEPDGNSAESRFRLFDALAAFWRRAAQRAPLLLIFEDLHWADATSLRLFSFLAAELEDSALLVVGTYRDTEMSRQHPLFETLSDLARSPVCQRIELAGLSMRETEELMVAATGSVATANFISALHTRTEGHPLFLEETLRYMIDRRAPQAFDAVTSDSRWLTNIPNGVREVIGKRLNRLSVPSGRLLSVAACIGRNFNLQLLAQLEADKSEDEIFQALEEALNEHLIEAMPETQFRFGHALIRETLYDEMLGLRRSRLHLRIGEILEQRHGAGDASAWPQLAYHFSEAGPGAAAGKALDYAKRAAAHAGQLLAFEESARLYLLALQLLQRHFPAELDQRCGVLLALAEAQTWAGGPETAQALNQQAAEMARQCGMAAHFAKAAIGFSTSSMQAGLSGEVAVAMLLEAIALHQCDDAIRVELTSRLCVAYVYCDCVDEAMAAHRRAVTLARRIGDMRSLFVALASVATAGYWPDLLQQRIAAANEAWAIADDLDLPERITNLLPFYLCDLLRAGDVTGLRQTLQQGIRLTEQRRAYHWMSVCWQIEVQVAVGEGRFDDAETAAARALEAGRRVGEDRAIGAYGMLMFGVRREQGRLLEALPMLKQFVREAPRANHWRPGLALLYTELDMRGPCQVEFDSLPWHRASLPPTDGATMTMVTIAAEVCVYLGDAKRAALLYNLLQGHAGANLLADSSGPSLGSTDRLLGSLATVLQQWDVAERHFEAALAMDSRTGWRVWLAHSRYQYALMLQRRAAAGDAPRALTLLAEALADSSALGMRSLTPRIEATAAAIASMPRAYPCGLTQREVGVLQLIAMGRNNREIAQVLDISPNTVANHVRSILEKSYTANRTEAAAFANREGLLKG